MRNIFLYKLTFLSSMQYGFDMSIVVDLFHTIDKQALPASVACH